MTSLATTPQDAAGVDRKPPEPVSYPSGEWCDRYAEWHEWFTTKAINDTTPPPGVDVAALHQIAGELRDNAHHHQQEDREVGILADEQEAQFNTELAERIERALTGDAAAPGVEP